MDTVGLFQRWDWDERQVRRQLQEAPRPRERERWHARWLLGQGWTQEHSAQALPHDAQTIGDWIEAFRQHGPDGVYSEAHGGAPPALGADEQAALKAAVLTAPARAGIAAASWSWKRVRPFVVQHAAQRLSPRRCVRALQRLGCVWKRPQRPWLQANPDQRAAFVAVQRAVLKETAGREARSCFVAAAHVRADGDLQGIWVQRGEDALLGSTSPRRGDKAKYSVAVCLETGAIAAAQVVGATTAETRVTELKGLREDFPGDLIVIGDHGPAQHGEAMRPQLRTPDWHRRLIALPPCSPEYNPAEAIGKWVREEVTANTCCGTAASVAAAVTQFLSARDERSAAVTQRCRGALHTAAFPERSRHPERRRHRLEQRRRRALQAALPM